MFAVERYTWVHLIYGLALALVVSCTFHSPPPGSDFGPSPTDPELAIKSYFQALLKDPYSAHYVMSDPYKAYKNEGSAYGGDVIWTGWAAEVKVNAKNSYGGYTGYEIFTVIFSGNNIINHSKGHNRFCFIELNPHEEISRMS